MVVYFHVYCESVAGFCVVNKQKNKKAKIIKVKIKIYGFSVLV